MERFVAFTDAQLSSLWQGLYTIALCGSSRASRGKAGRELREVETEMARRGITRG